MATLALNINVYPGTGMLGEIVRACDAEKLNAEVVDVVPPALRVELFAAAAAERPWREWKEAVRRAMRRPFERLILAGSAPLSLYVYAATFIGDTGVRVTVLDSRERALTFKPKANPAYEPDFRDEPGVSGPVLVFVSMRHVFKQHDEVAEAVRRPISGWATLTLRIGSISKDNKPALSAALDRFRDDVRRRFRARRGIVLVTTGPDIVAAMLGLSWHAEKNVTVLEWTRDHYEVSVRF